MNLKWPEEAEHIYIPTDVVDEFVKELEREGFTVEVV